MRARGCERGKRGIGKAGPSDRCHDGERDEEGHLPAKEVGEEPDTSRVDDEKNCAESFGLEDLAK